MKTTTNYTATVAQTAVTRKVDLYVQGLLNFESDGTQQLAPSLLTASGGSVCAGIVKLAQKVYNTLMSYDIAYDRDWGTALSPLMMTTNIGLIRREFSDFMTLALAGITDQIRAQETTDMPDDERVRVLSLADWGLYGDYLKALIYVTSMSGDAITLVVPISVVP